MRFFAGKSKTEGTERTTCTCSCWKPFIGAQQLLLKKECKQKLTKMISWRNQKDVGMGDEATG